MTYTTPTMRALAFIDGQNLHKSTKEAFGYTFPNYDVLALSNLICAREGWSLLGARFYTGVPGKNQDPDWNYFWSGKLLAMSRQGVFTFKRRLRYRPKIIKDQNGNASKVAVPVEKGIDVRIAIDIIRMAHKRLYDVALVFSQDQDLSEVADEIKEISREQGRRIIMASAFPVGCYNSRGINGTQWITFSRGEYDQCIDPNDYRQKTPIQPSLPLKN